MRRLLLLASAIVFVDTMFYAAIAPLLPELSDQLGLSKTAAGVLSGSYAAGTLLGSIPGGLLAIRVGVRATVLGGLALMSVSGLVFGLSDNIVVLDVARFVQGLGSAASWSGALAWLLTSAPRERRGELLGSALAAAIVGALFGPALGGLADAIGRAPVFSAVVVLGGALAFAAWRTPAPPPSRTGAAFMKAFREPRVWTGTWLIVLPGLLGGAIGVLVPLRLDVLGASGAVIAAGFLVAAALEAVVAPITGRISDRRGRLGVSLAGLAAGVASAIALTLPQSSAVLFGVLVLSAPAIGILWSPAMAMLSDGAEAAGVDQAMAAAMVNLGWALGQTVGSAGGARAAESFGDASVYLGLAAIWLVTLAVLGSRFIRIRGGEPAAVSSSSSTNPRRS